MKIIGRKDRADLPEIGIFNIAVKIDSGAYSCSIHCSSVKEVDVDGKRKLEVIFLDEEDKNFSGSKFYFDEYRLKKVKSSNGSEQERFFIRLNIQLFHEVYQADFSLTSRNGLRNPVLLGRKLLNHNFLIDTSKVNLSYKNNKKSKS